MRNRLVSVLSVGLLFGAGCKKNEPGAGLDQVFGPGAAARSTYEAALGQRFDQVATAGSALNAHAANLVQIASGNYSRVVSASPPTSTDVAAYTTALQGLAGDYLQLMNAAYSMVSYQFSDASGVGTSGTSLAAQDAGSFNVSTQLATYSRPSTRRRPSSRRRR
jgi:hypothetical protein